ncbi:polymorphic toxin-type HINT domain-containing protein [Streptomyces sparsogenes]|uniref:polymorphic toxin-type HINT domain-containing protein n=1 Tax=Streptomyces sparsogenes TaxID=67365 RepID=UPI0033C82FEF
MNQFGSGMPRIGGTARRRRSWERRFAVLAGFALVPGLLSPVAFADAPDPLGKPKLKAPRSSPVSPLTKKANDKNARVVKASEAADLTAARRAKADQKRSVSWPRQGQETLTLGAKKTAKAEPGALPVTLTPPTVGKDGKKGHVARTVTVKVLDQKAAGELGVKGVVLTATGPTDGGRARLSVDYSAFASAYGGDWAGRLQVVKLPDCALKDPAEAHCRSRETVPFTNDRTGRRLETTLSFASAPAGQSVVLALAAGTKSGSGDYKATPLAASSTWEAGGSSGSFTWSYPLRTPPAAAGPSPDLSISYDSGSVDGRTASTNNQGTAIGEGFDLTSSFIERKYGSCDDDGQDDKFDLCWKYDNASLVLNGKATELVKDDTSGRWRLKNDDASTVEHHTGAENDDDNGEYWTVTTGDGTVYTFGLNKLEGAGADDRTASVWTVPVFGDDEGEPGYADGSSFSGRDKKQAWRWNLDLVEDTHGNAMTYWYRAEENNYDKLGDDNTGTGYTRGGYLKEIRYGQRKDALFSATPAASNKVVFDYAERCLASGTGCDSLTKDTRDNWPDVPFDAVCKDDDKCTGNVGPSFFTRKRMTGITTYAWNAAASTPGYAAVDNWTLKQLYLDPGDTGDTADQSLWLDEIKHTGKHGSDLTLDPVKFTHVFLPNRVDGASDDILSLDKPRLKTVTSEAGAQTIVSYAEADCVAGQTMPKADENTRRCYPVYWSPNGEKNPVLDWFQKYPVTAVFTTDPYGGSEAVQNTYSYEGGGAWHYNDDPMTPAKERTWSIWRGFGKVTHLTGDRDNTQLKTVTVYLRGMNGDRVLGTDGKTPDPDKRRQAKVTGIKGEAITDSDQYAGFTRETVTYSGDTEVTGTVNDPWSRRTATQHKSYADTEAYYVRTAATHTRTRITSGLTPVDRVRTTATTYDDYGMAQTVEDRGDDAEPKDETCTHTWYARNDDKGINALVSRTRTTSQRCDTPDADLDLPADSSRQGDVISDTATAYDTTTWSASQKPTKGEAQWTGRAKGYGTDNAPVWQQTSTTAYDTLGRPTVVKDALDNTTATSTYTPTSTGPLTSTTVADAKSFKTTTALDFATGAALKVTDPNNKITESEYDALGRVTKVWLPNHTKVLWPTTPNYTYGYHLNSTSLPWISTSALRGDGAGYNTTYEIYDSLLRARQVQSPTPVGGRLIGLTLYDDRGLAVSSQADIWDETASPSGTPVQTEGSQAPSQTDTTYDGAGRATKTVTKNYGVTRWTTETTYTGDTVATSAPAGGQGVAEVTDVRGQTTERREYASPKPTGSEFATTGFTYTLGGLQKTITGPDKATWSYSYDLAGRQVEADDPDKGKTTTSYNALDQVTSSTNAEKQTLVYDYDELGRKTGMWSGTKTDANKLAAWTFDTLAKGQQDTAVRYDGGLAGKAYTRKVTEYDSLYQVKGSELTLPDEDPLVKAGVPKTLAFTTGYRLDGTISQSREPAVGGLAAETVSYTYNATGQQLTSLGTTGYLQGATFSPQGDLRQLTVGMSGTSSAKKAYLNYDYEPGTRRLTRSYVTDDVHGYMPQELKFTQDDAGNVTSIFDSTTLGGTGKADYQCFAYDGYRRMTEAWTPATANCATTGRTTANLAGAAPYWTSYHYNTAGQRDEQTEHATAGDTKTTYTYGTQTGQPHPLTKTETNGGTPRTYTYDKTGNTTGRPGTQATQTLTWNPEGKLATTTEPAAGSKPATATGYLYDADGELLIRRATTTDGDTVLYLGATEVRLTVKSGTKTLSGTRYYAANGQTIAVRTASTATTGTKLNFLAADHHGTSSIALDATTYAITKRYATPFGAPRGQKPQAWPDDKAFLGKPADTTTGLTHIGAREYDPTLGQFLSVDPVLAPGQLQSLNGYSYANQNPVTQSDPTGLWIDDGTGHSEPRNDGHGDHNKYSDGWKADKNGRPWSGGGTATTDSSGVPDPSSPGCDASCEAAWGQFFEAMDKPQTRAATGCNVDVSAGCDETFRRRVVHAYKEMTVIDDYYNCAVHGDDSACDVAGSAFSSGGATWAASFFFAFARNAERRLLNKTETSAAAKAESAERLAARRCHSFTAETEVELADGGNKSIEDVKVGDKVLATDPQTGKTTARPVVATIVTEDDKEFTDLTIDTEAGPASIIATDTHPFWVASENRWEDAGDLTVGMKLRTNTGAMVTVTAVRHFTKQQRTYDLTVDSIHTYYVLAGETPVLVHNSGPGCGSVWIDSNRVPHHFKHAADFGITAKESKASKQAFVNALGGFVKDPENVQIAGTYRGTPARHYVDLNTGRHVSVDIESGEMLGAWKTDVTSDQFWYLTMQGKL